MVKVYGRNSQSSHFALTWVTVNCVYTTYLLIFRYRKKIFRTEINTNKNVIASNYLLLPVFIRCPVSYINSES